MPNLHLEKQYGDLVVGVDEAGRGPLAGPVVAGAVVISEGEDVSAIKDSKKLSLKKRELIYEEITARHKFGVGIVEVEYIEQNNILQATKEAMRQAVKDLMEKYNIIPDCILIDGNQKIDFSEKNIKEVCVVKGDNKYAAIAAGSIFAKVTRDRIMQNLHKKFPQYGWQKNSAYPTKKHLEAIAKYGVTEHHRCTFAPVKKFLQD